MPDVALGAPHDIGRPEPSDQPQKKSKRRRIIKVARWLTGTSSLGGSATTTGDDDELETAAIEHGLEKR